LTYKIFEKFLFVQSMPVYGGQAVARRHVLCVEIHCFIWLSRQAETLQKAIMQTSNQ